MISTNKSIITGQHRNFLVEEQKENFTLLKDTITNEIVPFKKIYIPKNESVILYVSFIDSVKGDKPRFEYSVLNDYIEGKAYLFEVINSNEKGYLIEDNENIQFFIPIQFKSMIDEKNRINLTIDKIDLASNKLIFNNNFSFNGFTHLDANKIYEFEVVGVKEVQEDVWYLNLKKDDENYSIKALPFQINKALPFSVFCQIKINENKRPILIQDRNKLIKSLYSENNCYEFDVISKEKTIDNEFAILEDRYGFKHRLYNSDVFNIEFENLIIGEKCELYVKLITENGYLVLYYNNDFIEHKFYDLESVFSSVKITDTKKYFFNLEDEFNDFIGEETINNPFENYKNKENLWIFSYLQFIYKYYHKLIRSEKINEAIEFIEIYIKLEEWILEDSDYLKNFSAEKRELIILKAETTLKRAHNKLNACKIILDPDKSSSFIENTLEKLKKSGRLRSETLNTFKDVLTISNTLFNKSIEDIIEIIVLLLKNNLLDSSDSISYRNILEYRINSEKKALNNDFSFENSNTLTDTNIDNIIKILLLQILLDKNSNDFNNEIIDTANLFRFYTLKKEEYEEKRKWLLKSIEVITRGQKLDIDINRFMNFNLESINLKIDQISDQTIGKLIFKNNGAIYESESGWHFFASSRITLYSKQNNFRNILSLYNGMINISVNNYFNSNLDRFESIENYLESWNKYYHKIIYNEEFDNTLSNFPNENESVDVIVKKFGSINTETKNINYFFVKISDLNYNGEGIFHNNYIFPLSIFSLYDIFKINDRLTVKVLRTNFSENKISFTLIEDYWNETKNICSQKSVVNAQVVSIDKQFAYVVTEDGLYGVFEIDNNNIQLFDTYAFSIHRLNDEKKLIELNYLSKSDISIDAKTSLREFIINKFGEKKNDNIKPNNNIAYSQHILKSLRLSLEGLISLENDFHKKIEGLQILKLICSINKDYRSYFYDQLIKYYNTINKFYSFKGFLQFKDYDFINEQTLNHFPSLYEYNNEYKLLSCFNNIDSIEYLKKVENDTDLVKLNDLILAHNIIKKHYPANKKILSHTKSLINESIRKDKNEKIICPSLIQLNIEEISKKPSDNIHSNIGKEDNYREFKSSIYYNYNNTLDVEKQSFVILKTICGFLNSQGGSLFIGVNDKGDIIGLSNEYSNLIGKQNSDNYERFIRNYIVSNFNKDVNSLIEFKFHSFLNSEYLELVIPEYNIPISLKNEFYQRQGNETRILKGNDLTLFFQRKLLLKNENIL